MPLGFGDRSTVELLLEITGRNDASGAVARAAEDMRKLAAAKDIMNARSKAENDLLKANNDLRRAANDLNNMERSAAAHQRGPKEFAAYDNPDKYVRDLARAEEGLKRLKRVQTESGQMRWMGLKKHDIDALQKIMDDTGMSAGELGQKFRNGEQALAGWNKESRIIGDKLINIQHAQERLNMAHDEGILKVGQLEQAVHGLQDAQFRAVDKEAVRNMHNFSAASKDAERAVGRSARTIQDAGRVLGDFDKVTKKAGKDVDETSRFLAKLGSRVDSVATKIQRLGGFGFAGRAVAGILALPFEGLGGLIGIASKVDKFISPMLGPLHAVSGPLSLVIGLVGALVAALAGLPVVVGLAVAALTALADVVGAGLAVFVGLIPPVAMLVGLMGGLGAAFAYVTAQSVKNASSSQDQADALAKLHSAQEKLRHDVSTHAANSTQLNDLVALHKAQDVYAQSQLGVAINSAHIESKFKALTRTLSRDFAPSIIAGTKYLSGWLGYLNKVAAMPLDKAFGSLSTQGVNRLHRGLEGAASVIGPIFREAILVAFTGQDLRNKMVHDWNQLLNFLSGPNGALNPVDKWFNSQHFQRTGFRWAHELEGWIVSSGLLANVGTLLGNSIEDGIKFGVKAGFSFLKSELSTVKGWLVGGGLIAGAVGASIAGSVAKSLIGAAGGAIAARITGGVIGGAVGGAASGVATGQLALFGGAGAAAGGLSMAGLAAFAAPALALAIEGYLSTTAPRLTGIQRLSQLTPLKPVGVTGEAAFGAARFGHLRPAAIRTFVQQLSANGGFGRFSRSDTVSGARDISSILGLSPRAAELNRSFSLQARRPLAPNELFMISHNMGLRQGISAFSRMSGGRLPGQSVLDALSKHPRIQQLTGTLAAVTKSVPTPNAMRLLAHVPTNAISAVEHLIRVLHHLPTKKQINVTVKGVEDAQKKTDNMYKKLHQLSMERHQIQMRGGNTQQVDHQITGIQNKLKALSKNRTDVGKGLYLKPQYATLTRNAHSIGTSIDAGVAAGLAAGQGALDAQAAVIASGVLKSMQNAIKSHSPSQEAAIKIGVPIIQGITVGMMKAVKASNSSNSAKSIMQTMLQTMLGVFDNFKSQFQQGFGSLFTGPGGSGVNPRTGFATPLSTLLGFPGAKIPFSVVSGDLRAQLATFKKFNRGLTKLQHKGYPLMLIQQIAALGPAAQPEIDSLLSADRSEVRQYSKMFNESQKIINSAAMKQSIIQLDIWKSAGKGVAFGILAGLRSAEPGIEELLAHVLSKILKGWNGHGHGHSGTHPHTVVNQTIHAMPGQSTDSVLRRASFHYRNTA